MKFNEKKFEQMAHGEVKGTSIEPYKTPMGEEIQIKETVRGLGIQATNDLKFKEHIEKVTTQSKVTMGSFLRTFSTREKEPMIKMFNSYIRSKMEYCSIVWSPVEQRWIEEIEKNPKNLHKEDRGHGESGLPPETEEIEIIQFGEKKRKIHDNKWVAAT